MVLLLFYFVAISITARDVVFSGSIDSNRLVGSAYIYFLLGLSWAVIYFCLDLIFPNSFVGISASSGSHPLQDFIYYSFVTLTILGYGDIQSLGYSVRAFSYLEAACGVLYLAVLIASLVGTDLNHKVD